MSIIDPDNKPPSTTEQIRRFGLPAVIVIFALLFVFQNTEDAPFDFMWFSFTAPLWMMILIFMAIGAIVFWGVSRRRAKRKARRAADD